jgi:hypothetical protein
VIPDAEVANMRVETAEKQAQLIPRLGPAHVINLDRVHARQAVFHTVLPPRIAVNDAGDVTRGTIAAVADRPLCGGCGCTQSASGSNRKSGT